MPVAVPERLQRRHVGLSVTRHDVRTENRQQTKATEHVLETPERCRQYRWKLQSTYRKCLKMTGGDIAHLVEHRTSTPLTQVRFPGTARDFSPRDNVQCRLSYGVQPTPVRNRMHLHLSARYRSNRPCQSSVDNGNPACTVGWVARLCRSCPSPRKATRIFHRRNPIGTIQ